MTFVADASTGVRNCDTSDDLLGLEYKGLLGGTESVVIALVLFLSFGGERSVEDHAVVACNISSQA
jgi:hypothetical protein